MTEEMPDAQPGGVLDPSVAARLAVAENHLASQYPLLTPEAQAAMLARVLQAAAAADPAPVTATVAATGTLTAAPPSSGATAVSSRRRGGVRVLAPQRADRAASAFAQALEEAGGAPHRREADETGPAHADREPGHSRLVSLASTLGALPRPELDPEVKAIQRARLVAAMEQTLLNGSSEDLTVPAQDARRRTARGRVHGWGRLPGLDRAAPPRPRSRFARTLAALGLVAGLTFGGMSGLAASSTDALPGDALYGVKLGVESWRLGMADGATERGAVHLGFASTRLAELQELEGRVARDNIRAEHDAGVAADPYTDNLRRALIGLLRETTAGKEQLVGEYRRSGSQEPIKVLTGFSEAHRGDWAQVRARLPARLEDVADAVTVVFDSIERATTTLRDPSAPTTGPSPARHPRSAEPGGTPDARTHRVAEI